MSESRRQSGTQTRRALLEGLAPCPHRPPCSACPRYGEPDLAPRARRGLEALARMHGLEAPRLIAGSRAGFRLRARLAVRGRLGSPKLGLYEAGTHRVVHVPNCQVHHPLINRAAAAVRQAVKEARVSCYSDGAHSGTARHLQIVVERASQTAQLVLVANAEDATPLSACFELIQSKLGADLHSLWFNANRSPGNVILGPRFERVHGPATVIERFGAAAIHYPPGAFGQSNLEVAGRIIDHLRERIPHGARVAEFYAGVGAIGLSLLARVAAIRLNEWNPHSLGGLALGIEQLAPADRAKVCVLPGPAAEAFESAGDAQVVIVDPPRKGLEPRLMELLRARPPQRLLYVSCGLDSLRVDIAQLTSDGRLRLAELAAFDMMPYTDHVETVATLEAG